MATTTYLSQPNSITIGGVDLTDQCSAITFTLGSNPLTSTAFGDLGERMVPGLQTVEGSVTLYASYGAGEVEATLNSVVGLGTTTIVVKVAAGAISASNPEYTITNTMVPDVPSAMTVGELQVYEVSFSGGTWVRDITP
ncbi:hypothetical protein UFOVP1273_4 [uncultured Caudovirales phage]|uniref:Uncharacterized protein n=1 Tax=uncultured Caudovirales phage TaxID=2100421 RepID=A0A6J5S7V4_9CAUD|nr:hypothetical protein UFOVP1057_4 [uncultured Caudovirales phage]CAB4194770.1 hypothetical protein UFOVP1273_4 [uncultured Caudovirales phage]CAB4204608.1 hypothetical protein UFOVP1398_15 [uncultured Caudovirales phage]CAB5225759.1 hypothetical protein UFOVP1508_4 [uncultured Caudovirales phage]